MTTLSNRNCPLPLLQYLSSFPVLIGVRVTEFDLFFCEELCRLLFVLFLLAIVLSVPLELTDSDYPFGIFKHFL
jgi:hypothetical protein